METDTETSSSSLSDRSAARGDIHLERKLIRERERDWILIKKRKNDKRVWVSKTPCAAHHPKWTSRQAASLVSVLLLSSPERVRASERETWRMFFRFLLSLYLSSIVAFCREKSPRRRRSLVPSRWKLSRWSRPIASNKSARNSPLIIEKQRKRDISIEAMLDNDYFSSGNPIVDVSCWFPGSNVIRSIPWIFF